MGFSQRIKKERLKRKWTRQQAADRFGVSIKSVDAYEAGLKFPRPNVVRKMLKELKLPKNKAYTFFYE